MASWLRALKATVVEKLRYCPRISAVTLVNVPDVWSSLI